MKNLARFLRAAMAGPRRSRAALARQYRLEGGTLQDEAAMAVLHQWALKDPPAALQWAETFSEPMLRERALAEVSNLCAPVAARTAE